MLVFFIGVRIENLIDEFYGNKKTGLKRWSLNVL